MIFLDASFLIAVVDAASPFHARAQVLLAQIRQHTFGECITTVFMVAKAATLLIMPHPLKTPGSAPSSAIINNPQKPTNNSATGIHTFKSLLQDPTIPLRIARFSAAEDSALWEEFERCNLEQGLATSALSYADCASLYCCRREHIDTVVSFDPWMDTFLHRVQ